MLFNDPVALVVISGLLEKVELLCKQQFHMIEQFTKALGKQRALTPEEGLEVGAKKP